MSALTHADFDRLRERRARDPEAIGQAFAARTRRPILGEDGKLFIVAADHPARNALGVGDDQLAMADRYALLDRIAIALEHPGVDGVLGTPDILDDLALLGRLDGRVAVASLNRGGLRGSVFEMDDRFTGHTVAGAAALGLDMAKTLVRIDLDDPLTARTLQTVADAMTDAAAHRLPVMLEPFMSGRVDGQVVNDLRPDAVIHSVAIASALGGSSAYSWLKLPVVDDMASVMAATTLPTLLLGGDRGGSSGASLDRWGAALDLPGVRGLTVGRTLLYPEDGDVRRAIDEAATLVHPKG